MTASVTGADLGLSNTSLDVVGLQTGRARVGQSGENVYVNVATGNLVLQDQDELLVSRGAPLATLRTYNSQGVLDGDNNDNWRIGFYRQLGSLTGTLNTQGSSITRTAADGSTQTFVWDSASSAYLSRDGAGSYDTLVYQGNDQWLWSEGDSGATETYRALLAGGPLLLQSQADANGNVINYQYDANGLLQRVSDALGQSTVLVYDSTPGRQANLLSLQSTYLDPLTNTAKLQTRVRYGYDALNRLTSVTVDLSPADNSITDGRTYTTTYSYDGDSRRLASMAQSDGSRLSFSYDDAGRLLSVSDALGAVTRYAYGLDASTVVTDPSGAATRFDYDASKRLVKVTGPAASQQFFYNGNGDLTRSIDGEGNATDYAYDSHGNQLWRREATGAVVTRVYNARNHVVSETVAGSGLGDGARLTTRYVYDDERGQQLRFVITPEGRVTEYRYGAYGLRVASVAYAGSSYPTGSIGPALPTEAQMAAWVAGIVDKSQGVRTDFAYDFRGQLSSTTAWSRLDSYGQPTAGSAAITRYVYDAAGRLLQSFAPNSSAVASASTVYDALGRVMSSTDAMGVITTTSYYSISGGGAVVWQTAADGSTSTSVYDVAGNLSLHSASNSAGTAITRYRYDANGRLRLVVDPTGVRNWTFYDAAGRKSGALDGNGYLTEYRYDGNDRVVETLRYGSGANAAALTLNADGSPSAAALAIGVDQLRPASDPAHDELSWNLFDAAGRLAWTVDASGAVTGRDYDDGNRLLRETRYANRIDTSRLGANPHAADIKPLADAANDRVTRYFYDGDGMLRGTLDAEGFLTETLYDAAARAWQTIAYATPVPAALVTSNSLDSLRPGANTDDIRHTTVYDGRGLVSAEVDGEGYVTEYSYDANGNRVRSVRHATPLTSAALAAVKAGSTPSAASTGADQVTTSTFDALNRVVAQSNAEGTITTYTFDVVGNVTNSTIAAGSSDAVSQARRYDVQGNVIAEISGVGYLALVSYLQASYAWWSGSSTATQAQIDQMWKMYGTSYQYDLAGRRIGVTDGNGNQTRYFYDAQGQLRYTVNAAGEVEGWRYDAFGHLIEHTRYAVRISPYNLSGLVGGLVNARLEAAITRSVDDSTLRYDYQADGSLAFSRDELGQATRYQYNAFGDRTATLRTLDAGRQVVQSTGYDRRGLKTSDLTQGDGLQLAVGWRYDAFGRVVSVTDAMGKKSLYRYDRLGREVWSLAPGMGARSTSYDAFKRVLTRTDGNGKQTIYRYDDVARSVSITTPEGVSTVSIHNRQGEIVQVKDGRGNTTRYYYNADGRLVQSTDALGKSRVRNYDRVGNVVWDFDELGHSISYTYDAANRVLSRSVDPSGLALTTRYAYDAAGRVISETAPDGTVTQTRYDQRGQVVSITHDADGLNLQTLYQYDVNGNVLSVTEAAGTSAQRTTAYGYDGLGRRVSETVDPLGLALVTRYAWDGNGNLLQKIDPAGNSTRYVYDNGGRVAYEIDATGAVTAFRYDGEGRQVAMLRYAQWLDPAKLAPTASTDDLAALLVSSPADELTRTVFDGDGRAVFQIDALGQVTGNDYDGNGNLVRQTVYAQPIKLLGDPDPTSVKAALAGVSSSEDRVTRYVYDADNRLLYTISPLNTVSANVYDAAGNLVQEIAYARPISLPGLPTATQVRGAIASSADPLADRKTNYILNALGRAVYVVDPLGYITQNDYDAAGRVLRTLRYAQRVDPGTAPTVASVKALLDSGAGGNAIVETQTWDGAGRLVDGTDGTGVLTHRDYDAAGRVVDLTVAAGTAAASRTHYDYDRAGRLLARTEAAGTSVAATTRYRYDALGNIIATIEPRGVELAEADTDWALQQRAKLGYVDASGQPRLAASLSPSERESLYARYTTRQEYDANGQVIRITDASGAVTSKSYDAFGNVVAITDPRGNSGSFGYDVLNRVTSHLDPLGQLTETSYTRSGKTAAVNQHATNAVTRFAYDKLDRVVQVTDAEGYTETTTWDALGNKTSVTNKLGGCTTYAYDQRGQLLSETLPITSLDGNGNATPVTNRYEYDALGNRITTIEAAGLPEQRITHYEFDANKRQTKRTGEALTILDGTPGAVPTTVTPVETQAYDARGNLIARTDARGQRTLYWYDARNRKIAELDADGSLTTWTYNAGDQPILKTTYAEKLPLPDQPGTTPPQPTQPTQCRQTWYEYYANQRLTATVIRNLSLGRYNSVNGQYQLYTADAITRQVYDAAGNLGQSIDPNGNTTSYWYDALGQKILQVDAEGFATAWRYDGNGKVVCETRFAQRASSPADPAADGATLIAGWPTSAQDRINEYRYDRNGRLLEERHRNVSYGTVDASGSLTTATADAVTTYTWNGLGLLTEKTDANGAVQDLSYDLMGRQTEVQEAVFTDFQGDKVRPTTDTRYDGLGNVTSSTKRGKNSSGAEDEVTRYTWDNAGHLQTETDPTGAITHYDYDAAGNVTRKTRDRTDADGVTSTDTTTYRYDEKNRQIEQIDQATGTSQQTRYDAWGEVIAKGTNNGWQEFAEYDAAGRVFRSNSNDGVTRAYVYDAAGNATLKIESSGADLRNMTLSQMLRVSNGSVDPNAQDGSGVHLTISAYDRRNQLTDTWQPQMVTSRAGAQVQSSSTTVKMSDSSYAGVTVTAAASDISTTAAGVTGQTAQGLGVSTRLASGSALFSFGLSGGYSWFSPPKLAVTVQLPDAVDAWGTGSLTLVAQVYASGGTLQNTFTANYASGSRTLTVSGTGYFTILSWLTCSVYKNCGDGKVLLAQCSFASQASGVAVPLPKLGLVKSANASPANLSLYYRPANSSGPFQLLRLSQYASSNGPVAGMYAFDWGSLLAGSYAVRLIATAADGTVLDFQTGSLQTDGSSASVNMAPANFGPAVSDSFLFSAGNLLEMTAQGSNANSLVVHYRLAGSNAAWSDVLLTPSTTPGALTPGWFSWKYGQLTGDYEVIFESHTGTKGDGDIINRLYASVRLNASPAFLVGPTPYQQRPSSVRFDGNPVDASSMTVRYRPLGSSEVWSSTTLTPTTSGSGSFLWDASALVPYDQTSFRYEFQYEVVNAAGMLVNKGGGSMQLGSSTAILSQYVAPPIPLLRFSPQASAAASLVFYYRVRNSTGDFSGPVSLTRSADGNFTWDASTLKPASGTADFEYFYDLLDAQGTNLGRTNGYFSLGDTKTASSLQWVVNGLSSSANVIHHRQKTDAFGEVVQETDGLGHVTDYAYNALGFLTQKLQPTTTATLENGYIKTLRPQTLIAYDPTGQVVAQQDPNGHWDTQTWLAGERRQNTLVRHADGSSMRYGYDIFGNLRTGTDGLGHETDYFYDLDNRLVRQVHPQRDPASPSALAAANEDRYEYDQAGNRIGHTNALGLREKTYYDSLGRVVRTSSFAGRSTRYDYAWSTSLTGAGGAATSGLVKTTTDANGRTVIDASDLFGRLLSHQDLGGHSFSYSYNNAGWLTRQTGSTGQDIVYDYYANGYIRSIRDRATHTLTSYEYDAEGNKTFEGYALLSSDNQSVIDFAQQASITYDALNRVSTITDPRYSISYEYDAAGNRRHMLARYHDGVNGSVQMQDYWYRYDAANRFTLSMGQLSVPRATQETDTSVSINLGVDGVQLAYDLVGQRVQAAYLGSDKSLHVERYSYTADGYLEDTTIDGVLRARRQNDALGRVTTYSEYNSSGGLNFQRSAEYDRDNLLQRETSNTGSVTNYYRAADGTLNTTVASQASSTTTTYYGYEWWDSARQSTITSQPYSPDAPGWQAGTSHLVYDANGHLKEARDEVGKTGFRYVSNAQGLVMEREEYMPSALRLQHYYYLDGKRVGDVGNGGPSRVDYVQALSQTGASKTGYRSFQPISSVDFDQNYQPINPSYPGATPTSYTVKAGDSLRSIASQLWGDPAMWYLIADANGLSGSETLSAGTSLTIPNKVTNFHNNKDTVSVYNPGEAMGDVAPNLPAPPPPPQDDGGCGGFGTALVLVVAAVATVFTAGAAAVGASLVEGATLGTASLSGIMSAGVTALSGGYAAGGLAAAIAGGAIGSIAGQAVGIMAGVQDHFSWDKVAMSALGAGVGAGIGKLGIGASLAKSIGLSGSAEIAGAAVATQVAGNVLSQGIATAAGLQPKFDWRTVAASALGAGVSLAVGTVVGAGNALATTLLSRFAGGLARASVAGQGIDWASLAGDTIGNSIAQSFSTNGQSANQLTSKPSADNDPASDPVNLANALRYLARNPVAMNEIGDPSQSSAVSTDQVHVGVGDPDGTDRDPNEVPSALFEFVRQYSARRPDASAEEIQQAYDKAWADQSDAHLRRQAQESAPPATSPSSIGEARPLSALEGFVTFNPAGQVVAGVVRGTKSVAYGVADSVKQMVLASGDVVSQGLARVDNALGGNLGYSPKSAIGQLVRDNGLGLTALHLAVDTVRDTVSSGLQPFRAIYLRDPTALGQSIPAAVLALRPKWPPGGNALRNALADVQIKAARAAGLSGKPPYGFATREEFVRFSSDAYAGLVKAGYPNAVPVLQGSAVTGKKFTTGELFDVGRRSDFDVALVDSGLIERAKELGIKLRSSGTRTEPLDAKALKALGLEQMQRQLSRQAGRQVAFMIYDDVATAVMRGPSVILPNGK